MMDKREVEQVAAALKRITSYLYRGDVLVPLGEVLEIINPHMEDGLKIEVVCIDPSKFKKRSEGP